MRPTRVWVLVELFQSWPLAHLSARSERSLSKAFVPEWPWPSRHVVVRESLESRISPLEKPETFLERVEKFESVTE